MHKTIQSDKVNNHQGSNNIICFMDFFEDFLDYFLLPEIGVDTSIHKFIVGGI